MNRHQPGDRPDAHEEDFADFVVAARSTLVRTAWLLTGSAPAAEDLVQEALVQTYLTWRKTRLDNPVAYTRRVLVHRHIDRWRRAQRELAAWVRHGVPTQELPNSPSATSDERDLVIRLLQTLTPRERAVVVLRHYADLSEQQVAAELGISVGTVKSTSSRGLARLRRRWPAELMDEDAVHPGPNVAPRMNRTEMNRTEMRRA